MHSRWSNYSSYLATKVIRMYGNWLKPLSPPANPPRRQSFGSCLQSSPRHSSIGLIGMNGRVADEVREHLYDLAWDFGDLRVSDLGNLRKRSVEFVIPLLRELHTSGITPILIGGSHELFISQYLAFNELNRRVSMLTIDNQIELSPQAQDRARVLDPAVHRKGPGAFHLTHLGSQQHLVDPQVRQIMDACNYEVISLGTAQQALSELEPQIRDADLFGIQIRALQHYEAPARFGLFPSGFTLHQSTQLAYYAGNSDKLNSFGIYGMLPDLEDKAAVGLTAASYAQLIWYFILGYTRRTGEFPISTDGMTTYVVDIDDTYRLSFFRSVDTDRWWCEIPSSQFKGEGRHRLIACSYQDYLSASQDQKLPDRLLVALRRYAE